MTVKGQFGGARIAQAVKAVRLPQLRSLPKTGFVQTRSTASGMQTLADSCLAGLAAWLQRRSRGLLGELVIFDFLSHNSVLLLSKNSLWSLMDKSGLRRSDSFGG